MALQQAQADDVFKLAKDMLEEVDPAVKNFSAAELQELDEIMKKCISKEIKAANELGDIEDLPEAEALAKVNKIKEKGDLDFIPDYVDQETFTMDVQGTQATIKRGGQQFMDSIQLNSLGGIMDAKTIQIVSLVVESVLFVIGVIGIRINIKESVLRKIIVKVGPAMKQPSFQRVVKTFLTKWKTGGAMDKAKAIFNLVKETNSLGIFWRIAKMALSEMRWWEYAKAIAEIAALIVAAFATGGAAIVAKIALSVGSAINITRKVINLTKLNDMANAF